MASSSAGRSARLGAAQSTLLGEEARLVALIAQLDIAELERLRAPTGQLTDADVAMRLAAEEAMFQKDRELAAQLSTHGDLGWGEEWTPAAAPPTTDRSGASGTGTSSQSVLGSALSRATRKPAATPAAERPRLTGHNCAICMDPIRGVEVRAPCGDYYDKACMLELFEAATRDESLFPPRCCRQPIPLESVWAQMDAALVKRFAEKKVEFGTLRRVYCVRSACSRFLGAQVTSLFTWLLYKTYACTCGARTCTWCRDEVRTDNTPHRCTSEGEREDRAVLALGAEAGWARCPGCAQLIELSLGCYHMTCRCKTEFCYLCRARWKTCECTQWDENRLFAAAEARVDAELADAVPQLRRRRGIPPPPPPPPTNVRPARPVLPHRAAQPAVHDAHRLRAPALGVLPRFVPRRPDVPVRPASPVRLPATTPPHPPPPAPPLQTEPDPGASDGAAPARALAGEQLRAVVRAHEVRTQQSAHALLVAAAASRAASAETRAALDQGAIPASGGPATGSTTAPAPVSGPSVFLTLSPSNASATAKEKDKDKGKGKSQDKGKQRETDTDATRNAMVQDMMERLREDHECAHTAWKWRGGGGRCEMCNHALPHYLFRCKGCAVLACNRCRKNRI